MGNIKKDLSLSVIIPTLNEARNLPYLLADLRKWDESIEILVIDGGSYDLTLKIATLYGAKVLTSNMPNRGLQLTKGANIAKGNWLLFLHADSRLSHNWPVAVIKAITKKDSKKHAYFFNFRVNSKGLPFRLLEMAVYFRSNLFKKPYGDQGLLIHKVAYKSVGGYANLELMEDLEFIIRITGKFIISSLSLPIYTSCRRWEKNGVFKQSWKNLQLRMRWAQGESSKTLASEYYLKNK